MKQYEKILAPCSESEATHRVDGTLYRQEIYKIVLSAEELREVWQNGVFFGNGEGGNADQTDTKNFKTFLQSKGITL
jgi:hypothetical protein